MQNERNTDEKGDRERERQEDLEEAKQKLRDAGDLYRSEMARDERTLREQRANVDDPNIQH